MYNCELKFKVINPSSVISALSFNNEVYSRSMIELDSDYENIYIKIEAKDITALRAAINDYIRLMRVVNVERWL